MKKELLVIVNQHRYGELKIWGVLTTRQVERGVCAGRVLFLRLIWLYLIINVYNIDINLSIYYYNNKIIIYILVQSKL
jgi:hypothetical protein